MNLQYDFDNWDAADFAVGIMVLLGVLFSIVTLVGTLIGLTETPQDTYTGIYAIMLLQAAAIVAKLFFSKSPADKKSLLLGLLFSAMAGIAVRYSAEGAEGFAKMTAVLVVAQYMVFMFMPNSLQQSDMELIHEIKEKDHV